MQWKNLGEYLGFSYKFPGDFEKNETATLVVVVVGRRRVSIVRKNHEAEGISKFFIVVQKWAELQYARGNRTCKEKLTVTRFPNNPGISSE